MDVRDFMLEQEAIRWHWKVKQGQSNKKKTNKKGSFFVATAFSASHISGTLHYMASVE